MLRVCTRANVLVRMSMYACVCVCCLECPLLSLMHYKLGCWFVHTCAIELPIDQYKHICVLIPHTHAQIFFDIHQAQKLFEHHTELNVWMSIAYDYDLHRPRLYRDDHFLSFFYGKALFNSKYYVNQIILRRISVITVRDCKLSGNMLFITQWKSIFEQIQRYHLTPYAIPRDSDLHATHYTILWNRWFDDCAIPHGQTDIQNQYHSQSQPSFHGLSGVRLEFKRKNLHVTE